VNGAVQQLAAGLACLPFAIWHTGPPVVWQPRAFAAALYLVIFGSIVGYSAYVYALDRLPVALVSLYTYVNPIVALFLGWLFYREPFGRIELAGMAVIFLGVAIVKRYTHHPTAPELD
jgi:drug/metabolite transporter (DMT)-like permease